MQKTNISPSLPEGKKKLSLAAAIAGITDTAANWRQRPSRLVAPLRRPAPLAPEWQEVQADIEYFLTMDDDQWDDDETAPDSDLVDRAIAVLCHLAPLLPAPPQAVPTGHGEIILRWKLPSKGYFYVSIFANRVVYDGRFPNQEFFFGRCDTTTRRPDATEVAKLTAFVSQHANGNLAELWTPQLAPR